MTTLDALEYSQRLCDCLKEERRVVRRYPLALPLKYRLSDDRRSAGIGKSLNVSSRGLLFETDGRLSEKTEVEVSLSWPVRLQDACALQLIMRGFVVRRGIGTVALQSGFYEFRVAATPGKKSEVVQGRCL